MKAKSIYIAAYVPNVGTGVHGMRYTSRARALNEMKAQCTARHDFTSPNASAVYITDERGGLLYYGVLMAPCVRFKDYTRRVKFWAPDDNTRGYE